MERYMKEEPILAKASKNTKEFWDPIKQKQPEKNIRFWELFTYAYTHPQSWDKGNKKI